MMRTWTLPGLAALFAVAVAASAVRAAPEAPTQDDKASQTLSIVQDLKTQLQDLKAQMSGLRANQDLQAQTTQDDISRLKADIARLKDEVARLSPVTPSVAASINPAAPASPLTTMGNIVLENRYASPATVFVNSQPFRLMPAERLNVAAPLGRFTTAVYTDDYGLVQAQTNRYLTPGRDYPIWIHP